ncbi:FMN-binding negative transcriptional regulator [Pedobacter sandarakinus]|uniref:FMN-binding negative transcriptional regulator n=1 Tax=Pedobacter sandarakinus TaxID=353156 RepID=UPI002245A4CF|nr:FMN-binding negative transcriptional regulator [Pedobacter sandarakinus]MCX2573831.1 FMN-binding negative transcriptional regulator [Pedobacter sandarakinus]
MYKLSYFSTAGAQEVLHFMQQHPFITLVGFDGVYPVATQIPVSIAKTGDTLKLIGHVMTKTDHCLAFSKNPNVLAIFSGAHAYVSASVYENPKSASTWNYKTVQAKGTIRLMQPEETYQVIKDLTDKYENPATSPAAFNQLGEDYIQKHLKAITGFEIAVNEIEHVFKLSQNHSASNQDSIIKDLEQSKDLLAHDVARNMKKK